MMTPDKDYGQLVTDNVFMYRPKHTGGFEVMGIEEVKAKFDIQSPAQVIDMLGLMGDSSDNIPGCPGVGEKTAQKLIHRIRKHRESAGTYRPTERSVENQSGNKQGTDHFFQIPRHDQDRCSYPTRNGQARPRTSRRGFLRRIFEELEFRTLIDRVLKKESSKGGVTTPTGNKTATPQSAPSPLPLFPEEGGAIKGDLFANFTGNEAGEAKKSNLETLETLNCDYQLIDTEKKKKRNYSKS